MKANIPMDPLSFFKRAKKADVDRGFLKSLRKDLVRHMAAYPSEQARPTEVSQSAPARIFWRLAAVPAFIGIIATFAVGSTVFAAQGSLPGDPLYSFKLLSEQVELATTITPEARSEARLAFAAKRVDEASMLVQENAGEPAASSDAYHEAMQTVLGNFNAQIAGAFAEARDLQEKNNASGSLTIAHDIKTATEAYKMTLAGGKEKGDNAVAQDIDQFIGTNNDFNNRANLVLSNASGTGEPPVTAHVERQDGGSENHSGNGGPENVRSNGNGDQNNASVQLPSGSDIPAGTNGQSKRDGVRGGGDGNGGESGHIVAAPQGVIVPGTAAPAVKSPTETNVATSSVPMVPPSSRGFTPQSSSSSSSFELPSNSSSGEQAHADTDHTGKSTESKNSSSSANTDGKSGVENKSKS